MTDPTLQIPWGRKAALLLWSPPLEKLKIRHIRCHSKAMSAPIVTPLLFANGQKCCQRIKKGIPRHRPVMDCIPEIPKNKAFICVLSVNTRHQDHGLDILFTVQTISNGYYHILLDDWQTEGD